MLLSVIALMWTNKARESEDPSPSGEGPRLARARVLDGKHAANVVDPLF
jgi:hypothetical protein